MVLISLRRPGGPYKLAVGVEMVRRLGCDYDDGGSFGIDCEL